MSQQVIENLPSQSTFDTAKAPTFAWIQWLQSLVDVVTRVITNRVRAAGGAAVNCNGTVQSTAVATPAITPKRFAELWVQARVTFSLNAAGTLYVFVYRTSGAIPINGAAPNIGDVAVGGDAFGGAADVPAQNFIASLSYIDSGLSATTAYKYYLAVQGTNGTVATLAGTSQMIVSEL